ncbi:MAG: hypothetical protein GY948_11040 [Alphaproteobacteria bacterium]|nr:hypothetical protein [Alphaproteobacteria bacterium]
MAKHINLQATGFFFAAVVSSAASLGADDLNAIPGVSIELATGGPLSTPKQMTCRNPRRSYVVTFDETARSFRMETAASKTFYQVDVIERGEVGLVVRGKTVNAGPDFAAYLDGKKRIDFFDGGQIVQTDPCE